LESNTYGYANAKPTTEIDPFGQSSIAVLRWGWTIAGVEPTPVGEGIMVGVTVVAIIKEACDGDDDVEECKQRADVVNKGLIINCKRMYPEGSKDWRKNRELCYAYANDVYAEMLRECEEMK
jgi:hypothetical protein